MGPSRKKLCSEGVLMSPLMGYELFEHSSACYKIVVRYYGFP